MKAQRGGPGASPPTQISVGQSAVNGQPLTDAAPDEEKRSFVRAVNDGLADLEVGWEIPLANSKARLGLK